MTQPSPSSSNSVVFEDRFGRRLSYLRLSVTDRCNYRCVYCMPAQGVPLRPSRELLTFEEIERIVRVLASGGVRRVRITGGEPLVRRDLTGLIARLTRIEGVEQVVMTTNAHLLAERAEALRDAGLSGLTISLDSLDEARFSRITRGGSLPKVIEGIEAAQRAGFERIKINTVVIRGFNDDELIDLVDWSLARGCVPRFIEFMPIGAETIWGSKGHEGGCVPAAELDAVLGARYELTPVGMVQGAGPARYFEVAGPGTSPGQKLGIISAVTQCFCDACNRIRLTPQGGLRACLADDSEVPLRDAMRAGLDDEGLALAVHRALWGKLESHSFDIEGGTVTRKQMVSIGG